MRLSRVSPPELVAGLCGLGLLIALFVPWFDGDDAWQALTVIDLLLALVGAAAAALPLIAASNAKPDAPITATALTTLGGIVATLLVLFRLLDPPGTASRDVGLYLGMLAALGVAAAAWRSMADERS
jgi:uncharacterized membrane protein